MIGKSLRERHGLGELDPEKAVGIFGEVLEEHAQNLVDVRVQDARMIACLVVRADAASARMCRTLGVEVKPGGTGVFGVVGAHVAKVLSHLPPQQRAWLEAPCGPKETKVLLLAGGTALLSLESNDGKLVVTTITAERRVTSRSGRS